MPLCLFYCFMFSISLFYDSLPQSFDAPIFVSNIATSPIVAIIHCSHTPLFPLLFMFIVVCLFIFVQGKILFQQLVLTLPRSLVFSINQQQSSSSALLSQNTPLPFLTSVSSRPSKRYSVKLSVQQSLHLPLQAPVSPRNPPLPLEALLSQFIGIQGVALSARQLPLAGQFSQCPQLDLRGQGQPTGSCKLDLLISSRRFFGC